MDWSAHLDTMAVSALLCALAGLAVPTLIGRIPEPQPEPQPAPEPEPQPQPTATPEEEPKELYAVIAASRGLAWRSALVAGITGGLLGSAVGWQWTLLVLLPLVPIGVALAVIDWRTRLLPTKVIGPTYALVLAGILIAGLATRDTDSLLRAVLGWLVAGGLYFVLWVVYPRGLGYGDVRLSGILGLALGYLGWGELLTGVYAGFLLGGVGGGLLSVARIVKRKSFPFGPFMLVGAVAGVLWGEQLWARLVTG